MMSPTRSASMKSALIWLVMLICSITLAVALLLSNYLNYQQQQQNLQEQLSGLLEIIAINAQSSLASNNKFREEQRLSALKSIPFIKNVHIYQLQPQDQTLTFFASYNKADTGPFPPQFTRVSVLTNPVSNKDSIEQAKAVQFDNQLLGYVYLRASTEQLQAAQRTQILITVLIAFAALAISYLLILKLQQRFTAPLSTLLDLVHKVARSKDYQVRAPSAELQEFNLLNRAFNTMMDRIESQLHKREQAEHEITLLNQSLEHKILERTAALKESNQELLNTLATLHKYQNQIVETEKMASLGQMVAGIAHEVNTPIGLGVTASTLLQDKVHDIEKAFEQKKLTSSQLERFLADSKENLGIIYRNLERAAGLISSFKQVAVDQSNDSMRQFNMQQLINEVLLSLRPNLKKTLHKIKVDCPTALMITSKPGPINQILINLIMNSLIHAFDETTTGEINITIVLDNHRCYLDYSDNGKGVPEHIRKRIFDPFVTTRRGEGGSGLGLHLVYNLVTQALNGKIQLESRLGEGIQIHIDFPVGNVSPTKLNN
ncbi:sensor histidine kinase [Alishewanella tabrizica]|uniref:histidine kinase n=1 Tax=Alishewanella tabrizica TaxID=671278 RepID=A0ABQ2WFS4_9ALTE|nr:sensor histidine kinase [Alishewanella tabrizica]GGW54100.1 hypothetical protein GCM10008111_07890 [Alishewanella tabrizica]